MIVPPSILDLSVITFPLVRAATLTLTLKLTLTLTLILTFTSNHTHIFTCTGYYLRMTDTYIIINQTDTMTGHLSKN